MTALTHTYSGTNRLADRLPALTERIEALEPDARAKFEGEMDITFEEHFAYQNAQARAAATGRITTDEALLIYNALGEVGAPSNGGWASDTPLPVKVVVTLAMGEILR